jgi:3-oxoacyl-[acyl-carrier-protein] synthase-3
MKACIAGIEIDLPERVVTNADLQRMHPDWIMAKIAERTGVLSRHICADDETALDIGQRASEALLDRLGLSTRDVGGVIFCTQTPDYKVPGNAALLHHRMKMSTSMPSFDISRGCSGFIDGLFLAKSMVVSGAIESILLITADTYTRMLHPKDRSTNTLLGEGGSACLIRAAEGGHGEVGEFAMGTDGGDWDIFAVEAGGMRVPSTAETAKETVDSTGLIRSADCVKMDGPAVLAFVRKRVPQVIDELFEKVGYGMEKIDLVVPHQASELSLNYVQRWLKLPDEKFVNNISDVGNLSSASIPVALRREEISGRLQPGMKVLVVGFGIGLAWGACLIDW